jgi:hypothetical protein
MKFALGGNHDENNTQTANELVAGILDESVYAEEVYLGDIFLVVAGPAVIAAALLVKQVVYPRVQSSRVAKDLPAH